jgi:hypothetical protein
MLFVPIPQIRERDSVVVSLSAGLAKRRSDPNADPKSKLYARLPSGRRLSFGPLRPDVLFHLNLKGLQWERDPFAHRAEQRLTAMYAHCREVTEPHWKGIAAAPSDT